ncbi:putative E3 ubiquitin-protein ligase LUL4 [Canna indica]|uniref:RING-type E3 ubiquitin transferase n=1 Tax=Canna indica TaxID=4628 RepID=A0AAQ3JV93_9LILI|nr:putative E3 ubiquitin-protein ligase LUL4 [Canna indica]
MGQSSSTGRRRNDFHQQASPFSYSSQPPPTQSAPIPSPSSHPSPPSQPPPTSYYSTPYPISSHPNRSSSYYRPSYPQYYGPSRSGGWWMPPPPLPPTYPHSSTIVSQQPAPAYVEQAKKVKNDINVHKDSIRLVPDEHNPDHHLVSFTFDAMVDGSVTVYYFAKEGANGIVPLYTDMYTPKPIPFLEGLGQKFVQPSGSGIDLGFFDLDELSHPVQGDGFPLVVYAESCRTFLSENQDIIQSSNTANAQITQAVIEKNNDGIFKVKVVNQILYVDGERYELQEIFGLVSSVETEVNGEEDADMGKECVICLSEPRDTAVLPCRHMCMCSECAKALRLQSNKCPICRQPVEQLMGIKVNNTEP